MNKIKRIVLFFVIQGVAFWMLSCSSNKENTEDGDHSERNHSRAVLTDLDSLKASQLVKLRVGADTILNCDSNSVNKRLIRQNQTEESRAFDDADRFFVDSNRVTHLNFLKRSSDSLYFTASMISPLKKERIALFCIDRKYINKAFVVTIDTTRKGRKGGGSGGGRRNRGGGMGGGVHGGDEGNMPMSTSTP